MHLHLMNQMGGLPWPVTFSYGRALQHEPQKVWAGKAENVGRGTARLRAPLAYERARGARSLETRSGKGGVKTPVPSFGLG